MMSQEMLWDVCSPFIAQMLEALLKSIRQTQEQQQAAFRQHTEAAFRQQHSGTPERVSATSPVMQDKDPDAFASLFDPPPDVAKRGQPLRRLPEDDERLEEQEAISDGSSSRPTPPMREVAPQKVKLSDTDRSSRGSSKGSSPALQG